MPVKSALTTLSQSSLQDYVDCARRFQLALSRALVLSCGRVRACAGERKPFAGGRILPPAGTAVSGSASQREHISKLANTPNLQRWWNHWQDFRSLQDFGSLTKTSEVSIPRSHPVRAAGELSIARQIRPARHRGRQSRHLRLEDLPQASAGRVAIRKNADARLPGIAGPCGSAPQRRSSVSTRTGRDGLLVLGFPGRPCPLPVHVRAIQTGLGYAGQTCRRIHNASSYPLTDDRAKCSYCPYRSYCDRGVRAGDVDQAEAETEAQELFDVNFEQIGEIAF
jgi:hypothetical protein